MTMPLRMAQNLVRGCLEHLTGITPNMAMAQIEGSSRTIAALKEVQGRVQRLIGGGYRLDRLQTTLMLCNEAMRMQEQIRQLQGDQRARLEALRVGLNEVQ